MNGMRKLFDTETTVKKVIDNSSKYALETILASIRNSQRIQKHAKELNHNIADPDLIWVYIQTPTSFCFAVAVFCHQTHSLTFELRGISFSRAFAHRTPIVLNHYRTLNLVSRILGEDH